MKYVHPKTKTIHKCTKGYFDYGFSIEMGFGGHYRCVTCHKDLSLFNKIALEHRRKKYVMSKIKEFIGEKVIYDNEGTLICGVDKNGGLQRIADLRGWGAIQNLFLLDKGQIDFKAAGEFQDELGKFIVDAINEKLSREI